MLLRDVTMVNSFFIPESNLNLRRGDGSSAEAGSSIKMIRFDGDGARDAEPLLLAGDKPERCCAGDLSLPPTTPTNAGFARWRYRVRIYFVCLASAGRRRRFVVNGFRERIGFLEDHADAFAKFISRPRPCCDVMAPI